MSVIASNSVNFVPIYQLLKNFTDITSKSIAEEPFMKTASKDILDVAELTISNKAGQNVQSNPISYGKSLSDNNLERPANVMVQEKVSEAHKYQLDAQAVSQNADSVRSFIVESTGKAMEQQANQSKQKAIFLI